MTLAILAIYVRQFIKGFKAGIKKFGDAISSLVNSLLLSIIYLIGVGATSLVAKIFKKHFLERMPDKKKKTYWSDYENPLSDDEFYRQF